MPDQKELQEKLQQYKMLQKQIESLKEYKEEIEESLSELDTTKEAIEEISNSDEGEEVMFPIGNGAYAKGELTDNSTIVVDLGSDSLTERGIDGSKELIDKKKEKLKGTRKEIDQQIKNLTKKLNNMSQEFQKYNPALNNLIKGFKMLSGIRDSLKDFSSSAKEKITKKELSEDDIDSILWDLETSLLKNNMAVEVIEKIKKDLREDLEGEKVNRTKAEDFVKQELKDSIREILEVETPDIEKIIEDNNPALFLFMGFNGSGKTTTISKFAHKLKKEYDVVMAAGDTFRAASIEQLEEHSDKLDVEFIKQDYGSDSAAVIYDAKEYAEKNGKDVILADTAGRSHTDKNLMDELEKIVRVNDPDFRFLVVDALSGNDAIEQAKKYKEIGFDGIIVPKVDVDERGGSILSLSYISGKPIMYIGVGQGYEDLEEFDPEKIMNKLFSE